MTSKSSGILGSPSRQLTVGRSGRQIPFYRPSSPRHVEDDQPAGPSPKFYNLAQRTDATAIVGFIAIGLCFTALYLIYHSLRERKIVLFASAAGMAAMGYGLGWLGEIQLSQTKNKPSKISHPENRAIGEPSTKFEPGQPVLMKGDGEVTAATQAIMNDEQMPRVFREICKREIDRLDGFKKFLDVLKSENFRWYFFGRIHSVMERINLSTPVKGGSGSFKKENIRSLLVMLMRRKKDLLKAEPEFDKAYPFLSETIDKFGAAKEEADFQEISWEDEKLIVEIQQVKSSKALMGYFAAQVKVIDGELQGLKTYQELIDSYLKARDAEPHLVDLTGRRSSPTDHIRQFMQGIPGLENAEKLFRCLNSYVMPGQYPQVYFQQAIEQEWMACDGSLPGHADQLQALPADQKTVSIAAPTCILTIQVPLTEGAEGQDLLNMSLQWHRTPSSAESEKKLFLCDGQPQWFYPHRERVVLQTVPERFVLQLKRFEKTEEHDCPVKMPQELSLGVQSQAGESQQVRYTLKTIVVHLGSPGLYYAMVRKNEGWYYANDDFIEKLDADDANLGIALQQGYLYCYEMVLEQPVQQPSDVLIG